MASATASIRDITGLYTTIVTKTGDTDPLDPIVDQFSKVIINNAIRCVPENAPALTVDRIFSSPGLSGPTPKDLHFSPDGTRITFLKGKQENASQNDLWEYDIASQNSRLLVDSNTLGSGAPLSEEEKAQRERKRNFDQGIVDYYWSHDGKALLIPSGGHLYFIDLTTAGAKPMALPIKKGSNPLDIQFSSAGRYVSYVRDNNLFLFDLQRQEEKQPTTDGNELVSNGLAEFIAQEEMERFIGYWWSPNDKLLAFERVDESPVKVVNRSEIDADGNVTVRTQRYPYAGSPNVNFEVRVFNTETGQTETCFQGNKDIYLARADWLKDGKTLALQILSRDHKTLDLIFWDSVTKKTKTVLTETSKTWINLHDDLRFLDNGFIWASERTGFKHLYLYDLKGNLVRPLTSGEWTVKRVVGVTNDTVHFEGFATSPIEKHLYAVDLSTGESFQITKMTGWHSIVMSPDCRHYIDNFSSVNTLPHTSLHRTDGQKAVVYLEENSFTPEHPYYPFFKRHSPTLFGTIKAKDGQDLHYRLIPPVPFDPNKKYPVIVTTYGGPHFRLVNDSWDTKGYWQQLMASKGFFSFTLDNRGSSERGKEFEDPIYLRLGEVEVEDQRTGAEFLKKFPFIDGDRIGIFGWSYGGFMTLKTMFKAWDIFKAGASVAPVTEWTQYDTCYTERYLGMPQDNKDGYEKSSVFPDVNPNVGKLLIVHGMADDNVLFPNTVKLIRKMQDMDIPFEFMAYPGSKHAISEKASRIHLYKMITEFFLRHLAAKD